MVGFLGKTLLFDSASIRSNAYNPRLAEEESHYIRGRILDSAGNVLAETRVEEDGTRTRVYPYGAVFAHVTGYSARTKTGLELELNEALLSRSGLKDDLRYLIGDDDIRGKDAVLTIDGELQQAAYSLMDGYRGAVVISEPGTGKILTLVSSPSYDPNTVSENWDTLSNDPDSPLYARATQGRYPPGSTFKIVTSLALYRYKKDINTYTYTCVGETPLGKSVLPCYNHTAHGAQTIPDAFANSCNTFFANAGLAIGGDALRKTAESLYINRPVDFILPLSVSRVVVKNGDTVQMVGETAIGQGESEITPFQMNLITSAVANQGMLYAPYLVDSIVTPEGQTAEKNLPRLYDSKMMTQAEAAYLESLMEGVVQRGTAASLSGFSSCKVYGKTGTAQIDDTQEEHSWFTGYTKVNGRSDIAITVLVENGAKSHPAVPIVYSLLAYYYSR